MCVGALKERLPAWWSSCANPQGRCLGARDSDAGPMLVEERSALLTQLVVRRMRLADSGKEVHGALVRQEIQEPRLALFTPKQEGCPEETGNTKKSSFPHTPDAAARTPVRLKVCAGARGGGHYPPENSRTGVDCSLSRVAPPPTTVQSLTPTTRASHQ